MFDRLEAHDQTPTERIENLPLPRAFVDLCGVETLMPAQQRAVESGLLYGKDLLVVAATGERQDLHRRDGGAEKLSRKNAGENAFPGPSRRSCEPEV